ncbi:hypothetical protein V8E51_013633 [Hyaloscypha variabilis]
MKSLKRTARNILDAILLALSILSFAFNIDVSKDQKQLQSGVFVCGVLASSINIAWSLFSLFVDIFDIKEKHPRLKEPRMLWAEVGICCVAGWLSVLAFVLSASSLDKSSHWKSAVCVSLDGLLLIWDVVQMMMDKVPKTK